MDATEKDYGDEYPVEKVPEKLTTTELVLISIILGTCLITFATVLWMPV